ncbi:MAG TPA: alpha-ketoglutarate-dependent dioxygenase AlkB [Chloroflexota bacterium]|nr:alpha-ketoglutarate-dependent dioxygenase AlkB [Chloroflexota bacterium]
MMALFLAAPEASLTERFLAWDEADRFFQELRHSLAWRQDAMRLGAKRINLPRLTAWYGDPGASYTYSGIRNEPLPWTPELLELKERIEAASRERFNSVLCNLYRAGDDSMGWHSDDEREIAPTIASLSLGAARTFQLRRKAPPNDVVSMRLAGGSLLLMEGECQRRWQHRVPKEPASGERINLTFRLVTSSRR